MALNKGKISIKRCDLSLKLMLEGGQSFRWKRKDKLDEWVGVFAGIVWQLTQSDDSVSYTVHSSASESIRKDSKGNNHFKKQVICYDSMLKNYLRVNFPLHKHYQTWSENDANFKKAAESFNGLRILDQDPVENLFSFICSSNNNIVRITMMIEKLCEMYGDKICTIEGETFYCFPHTKDLTDASVEESLRKAGFGYRAKFIRNSALKLVELGGAEYLNSLKKLSYCEAKEQLLQFQGIGPKVADCICLMSLGHFEAVPVDTHVFQVACQSYLPHLRSVKSVTDRVYREIGDFFRELYGPYAGWAHTILFCADLKKFQPPNNKVNPMAKKATKRKISR